MVGFSSRRSVRADRRAKVLASRGVTARPCVVASWRSCWTPVLQAGVVVRDGRGSASPPSVMTTSADRLDVLHVPREGVMLASPFEGAAPFVEVRVEGEEFVVNGTRLAAGASRTMEFRETLGKGDAVFELSSVVTFENVGRAGTLYQLAGGCL